MLVGSNEVGKLFITIHNSSKYNVLHVVLSTFANAVLSNIMYTLQFN